MMVSVQQQRQGLPSIASLPTIVIATIPFLVHTAADRNSVSQVCKAFRIFERQSRRSLALRAPQKDLGLVPLCFSSVTDLDLSALTLFPSELPSFELSKTRLTRAFPNVRTLKLMAVSDACLREVACIWPQIENLSFTQPKEPGTLPQLTTVLQSFKHCQVLDARNLQYESLHATLAKTGNLLLKSLNLESGFIASDLELELLAKTCPHLENLCITIHPGRVIGRGFLDLANHCRKLSKLRLFLYLDSVRNFHAENARKCLNYISTMTAELPDIEISISFQHIPSVITGYRMECLSGIATNIRSLVLYTSESDMKGVWGCCNLTELTFGSCEGLGDKDLLSVVRRCPKLRTLRILDCKRVTERGLNDVAEIARLTSLSLCFLKIPVQAQVKAVKPMATSLSAIRLMVNERVDSLCGLRDWPNLTRLELTLTGTIPHNVLMEPWLESCPRLKHLGLVIQNWCPSTLGFLSAVPSLPSLSISFSNDVRKNVLLAYLEGIALLPQLSTLSIFICNMEWLSKEAGERFARCFKLKSLNIIWIGDPLALQVRQFNMRPLLIQLLSIKCLQNVQLPSCLADEQDLKIFYRGLHAHTVQSILRSIFDLKSRDGPSHIKSSVMHIRELTVA